MASLTANPDQFPRIATAVIIVSACVWLLYSHRTRETVTPTILSSSASASRSRSEAVDSEAVRPGKIDPEKLIPPTVIRAELPDASLNRRKTTFRVRKIPIECDKNTAANLLQRLLKLTSDHDLRIHSLAVDATMTKPRTKTATVDFERLPAALQLSGVKSWEFPLDKDRKQFILVDTKFLDLTTLASPPPEHHKLDIIAVSGLGGHAFGSFKEKGGHHMWLRDSLPTQLETARILTWGHNSDLQGSASFQDLEALGRTLVSDLRRIDGSLIPKIFITHSLGGLIVKQAIILMQEQLDNLSLLESTRGILFFGVPNQGLDITSLVPMVQGQANELFLRTLGPESQLLRDQYNRFNEAVSRRDLQLVGYYETQTSPTAQLNQDTGKYEMTGPATILVGGGSARHGIDSEKRSTIEAINRSHSEMVKFKRGDGQLDRIVGRLQELQKSVSKFPTRAFTDMEKGKQS